MATWGRIRDWVIDPHRTTEELNEALIQLRVDGGKAGNNASKRSRLTRFIDRQDTGTEASWIPPSLAKLARPTRRTAEVAGIGSTPASESPSVAPQPTPTLRLTTSLSKEQIDSMEPGMRVRNLQNSITDALPAADGSYLYLQDKVVQDFVGQAETLAILKDKVAALESRKVVAEPVVVTTTANPIPATSTSRNESGLPSTALGRLWQRFEIWADSQPSSAPPVRGEP